MPTLADVLEAIARNVPWSQHNPHDPDLLAEYIEELKRRPKPGPKPKPKEGD